MWSAKPHRDTEALRGADGDISAEFARGTEESEGEQVGGHHGKCAGRVGLIEKLGEIVNAAGGIRVLHEDAEDRGGKIKCPMIADNKLNPQWLRAGADDIDGLRVAFF